MDQLVKNPSVTEKIIPVDLVGAAAEAAKAAGRTVVLCHGAFDLVHIGHIRHFGEARRHGDFLCVTITADEFIKKGPGRPVFNHDLRAEMVASLAIVDLVAVVHDATAIPAIEAVRPDIYVKGLEYQDDNGDVTGNITHEREAAERSGGRLVFTDEIVFSSSTLLNRYFDHLDTEARNFLDEFRLNCSIAEITTYVERASELRVLMIGDTIIDEYNYVEPLGKSPKENMIATLSQGQEQFAGGVIAAANHIAGLVKHVDVVTMMGDSDDYEYLARQSVLPNVDLKVISRQGAPTTRKTRFIDPGPMRKLFEVYSIDDSPLADDIRSKLDAAMVADIADYDLVVVTDFGHGLIAASSIELLSDRAPFLAVNTQTNSGNSGFNFISKYPRADFVCIDTPEARLAVGDKYCDLDEILLRRLPECIECDRLIITRGKAGCLVRDHSRAVPIPAFAQNVVDTVGAGDAFFAIASAFAAVRAPNPLLGFIGNVAGALKVEIVGHRRSIDKVALIKAATTLLK